MHALPTQLLTFFRDLVTQGRDGAVVTVLATAGSTYTKTGTYMLVADDGRYHGMVSGGCLEGDLAEHARLAIRDKAPRYVDYDLAADDELFGLGVGCEGSMRLLVRPLLAATDWQPFGAIARALQAGDSVVDTLDASTLIELRPPRAIAICGAGDDAEPLVRFALALGWNVTVIDHRPARVERMLELCQAVCSDAAGLADVVGPHGFDAAIVMTHNVIRDREYLAALAPSTVPFIGLLGPPQRRERLLAELGEAAAQLGDRLHAPVGRRVGGRGPAAIALEIAAELQAYFSAD